MHVTVVIYAWLHLYTVHSVIRYILFRTGPKCTRFFNECPGGGGGGGGGGALKTIKSCRRVFRTTARVTSRFL